MTVARQVLRDHKPADGIFPTAWAAPRMAAARDRYDQLGPASVT